MCPFCKNSLDRPAEIKINAMERVDGGKCGSCGALYLLDPTSKNLGEVMMQALGLAAQQLSKDASDMAAGEDYEDIILSYNWRTHRSSGEPKAIVDGQSRLYVIKIKNK